MEWNYFFPTETFEILFRSSSSLFFFLLSSFAGTWAGTPLQGPSQHNCKPWGLTLCKDWLRLSQWQPRNTRTNFFFYYCKGILLGTCSPAPSRITRSGPQILITLRLLRHAVSWLFWREIVLPCSTIPASLGFFFQVATCSATTTANAYFPGVQAGSVSTGQCQTGFAGSPQLTCVQSGATASFSGSLSGIPCSAVYCPVTTIQLATFNVTQAGHVATGACPNGYTGTPTTLCQQNGTTAYFQTNLTSSCARECPSFTHATLWFSLIPMLESSFAAITCPLMVHLNATYQATPVFQSAVGLCVSGWTGNPGLTCLLSYGVGVWSTNSTGRRCIGSLPSFLLPSYSPFNSLSCLFSQPIALTRVFMRPTLQTHQSVNLGRVFAFRATMGSPSSAAWRRYMRLESGTLKLRARLAHVSCRWLDIIA